MENDHGEPLLRKTQVSASEIERVNAADESSLTQDLISWFFGFLNFAKVMLLVVLVLMAWVKTGWQREVNMDVIH